MTDQISPLGDYVSDLIVSFRRTLVARNMATKTVKSYVESATFYAGFVRAQGKSVLAVDDLTTASVQDYIAHVLAHWKPSTASVRFKSLQQFFNWLVLEHEMKVNPMATLKPPQIPETVTAVLNATEQTALLKTCEGPHFRDRRDAAIIRLFIDTGMRAEGMTTITLDNLDLDRQLVKIVLKGGNEHICPFGAKAALALDRYLRIRARQKAAFLPQLWLGRRHGEAFTYRGLAGMIERRGEMIGIKKLHPHQFRHTFADSWLSEGGSEGDLMNIAGWKSRDMIDRYARSVAMDRAREAHKRLRIGDRV